MKHTKNNFGDNLLTSFVIVQAEVKRTKRDDLPTGQHQTESLKHSLKIALKRNRCFFRFAFDH